jgi:hypothetical protein
MILAYKNNPTPALGYHWNSVSLAWEANTGGTATGADVNVTNFPAVISGATVPVTGTFWQATQPVSGTFWQSLQPVSTKTALTPAAPVAVSVGIVSAQAVAANANRKGLLLVNTSANYISIGIGAAAVLYSGITLNPLGSSFWMDEYSLSTLVINAIASGAASNLGVQEFI